MGSIRSTINFYLIFTKSCFFEYMSNVSKVVILHEMDFYDESSMVVSPSPVIEVHYIWEDHFLEFFMLERDIWQEVFQVEGDHTCLSTSSSDSLYEIARQNPPLTLSNQAEHFTTARGSCKKTFRPIGQDLIGFSWVGWKTKDFPKSTKNPWEKIFLEHVPHHVRCSICGKKIQSNRPHHHRDLEIDKKRGCDGTSSHLMYCLSLSLSLCALILLQSLCSFFFPRFSMRVLFLLFSVVNNNYYSLFSYFYSIYWRVISFSSCLVQ
jgi:hypothetical protein